MRKTIVLSASVMALALSGCSPDDGGARPEASPQESASAPQGGPERSAPAKSTKLAEACGIVTGEQARALGADQPPVEEEINKPGCTYSFGEARKRFSFVALDRNQPFGQFVEQSLRPPEISDLAGYPMAQTQHKDTNCLTSVDIADEAALWVNTLVADGSSDPCETGAKFAEAALKNLQDAPGGQ